MWICAIICTKTKLRIFENKFLTKQKTFTLSLLCLQFFNVDYACKVNIKNVSGYLCCEKHVQVSLFSPKKTTAWMIIYLPIFVAVELIYSNSNRID